MKTALLLCAVLLSLSASTVWAAPLGTRTVLDNGAVLLVAERPAVPMVVISVLFKTGATADPAGKEGMANLTAELLTRGTARYTAEALAEELDFLGASLGTDADYDTTSVTLTTLTKNLQPALQLLAEVIVSPTFPVAELQHKRIEILGGLRSNEEDPGWIARKAFIEKLYKNPYGRLAEGQAATLAAITAEDVQTFHRTYYRPNNAIIAVSGDISRERAVEALQTQFAAWHPAEVPTFPWPESSSLSPTRLTLDKKVTQANVMLGHHGIARSNPDYYTIQVLNYILGGGGFESRLMKKIREELALVYSVGSAFSARLHPGAFTIQLQTKNATAMQAIEQSIQILQQFIDEGPSAQEVTAAKGYLINNFPLRLVSNRDVAGLLPALELYGLGLDYPDRYPDLIGEVTPEKVHAAAKTYLHPDQLLQVVVADLAQAGLTQQ